MKTTLQLLILLTLGYGSLTAQLAVVTPAALASPTGPSKIRPMAARSVGPTVPRFHLKMDSLDVRTHRFITVEEQSHGSIVRCDMQPDWRSLELRCGYPNGPVLERWSNEVQTASIYFSRYRTGTYILVVRMRSGDRFPAARLTKSSMRN